MVAAERRRGGSTSSSAGSELLQDRFKVSYDHVLGEGSFASVYKGLDQQAARNVAIKVYKGHQQDDAKTYKESLANFHGAVQIMTTLREELTLGDALVKSPTRRNRKEEGFDQEGIELDPVLIKRPSFNEESMEECLRQLAASAGNNWAEAVDLRRCFAELISHSVDKDGKPGPDAITGSLFIVTDIGEENLADRLAERADDDRSFEMEELRELHWSLVTIVCGLHAAGFVHLDIKPLNIMRFGPQGSPFPWRLIDFDGCVRTQTVVPSEKVLVTPWYMAPEIAEMQVRRYKQRDDNPKEDPQITVSRLMDVWSVGMCALEAVFLQPVLKPFFDEWNDTKRASSDLNGCSKFFDWLQDCQKPVMDADMCEAIGSMDKDLAMMLQGMLSKDPSKRNSISECLLAKWFEPVRHRLQRGGSPPRKSSKERRNCSKMSAMSASNTSRACAVM